jgi:hypothetical protein
MTVTATEKVVTRSRRPPAKRAAPRKTVAPRRPANPATEREQVVPKRPAATRERRPMEQPEPPGDGGNRSWQQRGREQLPTVPIAPTGRYRHLIVAEFLATVVMIGASPFLAPRPKDQTPEEAAKALSLAAPLVRLSAACIVFFVLALLSSGPRSGKLAAAFGGLVVLGVALNTTGNISGLNMVFTGQKSSGAKVIEA